MILRSTTYDLNPKSNYLLKRTLENLQSPLAQNFQRRPQFFVSHVIAYMEYYRCAKQNWKISLGFWVICHKRFRAELAYNLHNVAQCSFVSCVFCLLLMGQGPEIKWNEWMNNTTVSTTSDSDIFLACTHFKMFHLSSVHCPARFINQSRIDTL